MLKNLLLTSRQVSFEIKKHRQNIAKIHYQKLRSENIARKAKSCLEKLPDSSKSLETLTEVSKATHTGNEIEFEKGESSK